MPSGMDVHLLIWYFLFFLFLVGSSMRFCFRKSGITFLQKSFYEHIFWRSFSIFFAGIILNAFPFIRQAWDWSDFRIMGVLRTRISLAYGLSALLIIRFDFKQMLQILTGILLFLLGIIMVRIKTRSIRN